MDYLKLMQSYQSYSANYKQMPNKYQKRAHYLCWKYNVTNPEDTKQRKTILSQLFRTKARLAINSPFHCDYGFNIHANDFLFLNYGVSILDTSPVSFGTDVMVGPHVCLACSGHPVDYRKRKDGIMTSQPIKIGNYVWIGANCFIEGGIQIGNHTVIGAGSTVTHDIPANSIAFGSPCRVQKRLINRN